MQHFNNLENVEYVAKATGNNVDDVRNALSLLIPAFRLYGIWREDNVNLAASALATIAVECSFVSKDQLNDEDEYHGRGYIQLTGKANYDAYQAVLDAKAITDKRWGQYNISKDHDWIVRNHTLSADCAAWFLARNFCPIL